MMTVFVLAVLWLIVVVPMILRRSDERRRDRSVAGFGSAMRALGRRFDADEGHDVFVPSRNRAARDESRRLESRRLDSRRRPSSSSVTAARRPVPSAQEALMLPVDRSDMSVARRQMMARRRRSLSVLVIGALIFGMLAVVMGGVLWALAAPFLLGFVGYLYFLRSQASRDRARRSNRLQRTTERRTSGFDATEEIARFEQAPESMVRIDDDDIELHNLDTIDLTGIYDEELAAQSSATAQRRAS